MKTVYVIAIVVACICLLLCIYKAGKDDRKIADIIGKLLCAALIATLINIIIILTTDKNVCMVAYSAFFACMDWLLFYLLLFSLEF